MPFWMLSSLTLYGNQSISKLLRQRSSLLSYLALRICNLLRVLAFLLMNKYLGFFPQKNQVKFVLAQADLERSRGEILTFKDIWYVSLKSQITHFSLLPNIYYLVVSLLTPNSVVRFLESMMLLWLF